MPFFTAHHRLVSVEDDTSVITFIEYQVLIGNRKWIKEKNFIDIPHEIDEKMKKQEELGHTALLVAIDGKKLLLFLHYYFDEKSLKIRDIFCRITFHSLHTAEKKTLLEKMCSAL